MFVGACVAVLISTCALAASSRGLRPLSGADIDAWRTIDAAHLTADGQWFLYRLRPQYSARGSLAGEATIVIRSTHGDTERRLPSGDLGAGGGEIRLSGTGRWAAFSTAPSSSEAQRLRAEKKPLRTGVTLVTLGSGAKQEFTNVRAFSFSGERGDWIALHGYSTEGSDVSGVLLRNLSTGETVALADVREIAFDRQGDRVAWITELDDHFASAVQMRDLRLGVTTTLDASVGFTYGKLVWSENGGALAVMRHRIPPTPTDADEVSRDAGRSVARTIVAFTGLGTSTPRKTILAPENWPEFPRDCEISPERAPVWRDDELGLFFGIRPAKQEPPARESFADVLRIWHWHDGRLPFQQKFEAARDKSFSFLAIASLENGRFLRLADPTLKYVEPSVRGRHVLGFDDTAGQRDGDLTGKWLRDYYAVDLYTGQRKEVVRGLVHLLAFGFDPVLSPDGRTVVYYRDGDYFAYDIESSVRRNLTQGLGPFYDEDHGRILAKPLDHHLAKIVGWTRDGSRVLVSDHWDIWVLRLRGGTAENLTVNGRNEQTRYSYIRFEGNPPLIDLNRPMYFRTEAKRTKKTGLVRRMPGGGKREVSLLDDARFDGFQKARDADVYVYTRQTSVEFPDYYVTDGAFESKTRVTDANPQQREILWSPGTRLLTYTSKRGEKLQALLSLPAGYEEGRRYPTIVSIYETQSARLHTYNAPHKYGDVIINGEIARYTAGGYAVLRPDIVPRANDPGTAAVEAVLAAVNAAVASGVVDPDRLGLTGQSFGGYETSFIITQTDIFKAAVAVDLVSDLVSQSLQVYGIEGAGGGPSRFGLARTNQPYFTGPWWEQWEGYERNSPIFHAANVRTPLLIRQNDLDYATPFYQGVSYFNLLRYLGKPVVMLQYVGQGHGYGNDDTDTDFAQRMRKFFDHFLQDKPAPQWWIEGVPYLEMDAHLRQRMHRVE